MRCCRRISVELGITVFSVSFQFLSRLQNLKASIFERICLATSINIPFQENLAHGIFSLILGSIRRAYGRANKKKKLSDILKFGNKTGTETSFVSEKKL